MNELEILRRDAPLDDKKKAPLDDNKKIKVLCHSERSEESECIY